MSQIAFKGEPYAIWLEYDGAAAKNHLLDLYDFAKALRGFERSLALATHFVLNDEVITQVTSLRGAGIMCSPPQEGSFKIPAYIVAAGVMFHSLGSLENNNPLGHLIFSIYELAIFEATGQELDYDDSLREIYDRALKQGTSGILMPKRHRFDSLVEKMEPSIIELHRPIVGSETAISAKVFDPVRRKTIESAPRLNARTSDQVRYRIRSEDADFVAGRISSFNMNTFHGRLVTLDEKRPIPFFLTPGGRSEEGVRLIAKSLSENIADPESDDSLIEFRVWRDRTRTGRTAKLIVLKVLPIEREKA